MTVPPGRPDLQGPSFKAYAVAAASPVIEFDALAVTDRSFVIEMLLRHAIVQTFKDVIPSALTTSSRRGLRRSPCVVCSLGQSVQVGLLYFFATKAT